VVLKNYLTSKTPGPQQHRPGPIAETGGFGTGKRKRANLYVSTRRHQVAVRHKIVVSVKNVLEQRIDGESNQNYEVVHQCKDMYKNDII